LLSLAIADDIGAILVIAIGYTESLHWGALLLGVVGIAVVFLLARLGVRSFGAYTAMGVLVWIAFHASGVHATIAGVILGLQTPARSRLSTSRVGAYLNRAGRILEGDWEAAPDRTPQLRRWRDAARETVSPLEYLESLLHPWVAFGVMPLFALANAGVPFAFSDLFDPVAVAVGAGLLIGKPVGILCFSWLAVKLGLARLPEGVGWGAVAGGGLLAGIGFTMALFISGLALSGEMLDSAKVGVLAASALAAVAGMTTLLGVLPKPAGGSNAS
jgi:NhaA family Na+:H+ antiporter